MKSLRMVGGLHKIPKQKYWSLREYYDRKDSILIFRAAGGLGDILMHRMMFEDFKILCPETKLVFACPHPYMQAVEDHPFLDEVRDYNNIDQSEFLVKFDTTTICGRTEMLAAPYSAPARCDIWADTCGVKLTKHNMHLKIDPKELEEARKIIGPGPKVCFSPISAISSKNLGPEQVAEVCAGLKQRGVSYYGVHTVDIPGFDGPIHTGKNVKKFMALVGCADYIISVDTSTFHIGGGLGIPMVGVFSWADGKVYGKYYNKWELVQRHRDSGWDCGPCYMWGECKKCPTRQMRKPCITEITASEILEAFDRLRAKY